MSEHVIEVGSSFPQVINHMRSTERECIENYRGFSKISCHLYSVIGIPLGSEDPLRRYQLHSHPISSLQVVSETKGGS